MVDPMLSSLPLAQGKAIKPLAVTSARRLASAPEIPTVAESGMTGFEFVSWYGLWAPKNLPPALVEKLQTEVARIVAQPEVKQLLEKLGFVPVGSTTDYFTKFIADEMEKSGKIIADANIKTE
jgi:tripartite-type tricarboxylate transporter receptor subunit TctC